MKIVLAIMSFIFGTMGVIGFSYFLVCLWNSETKENKREFK